MDIQNVDQSDYGNLFPEIMGDKQGGQATVSFSGGNDNNTDILSTTPKPATEAIVLDANSTETKEAAEKKEDVDILGEATTTEEKKYDFSDTTGYFEDRIKNGKFVQIEEEDEKGNKKVFIPKTPEEFDEVIDMQVDWKLKQQVKDIDQEWYNSKSQGWQAVAKYAEMTDNPEDVLAFLQPMRTFNSVANLNPEDLGDAEKIVRERLTQRGDEEDVIAEQIEALKTTDKLVSAAQKYKPAILTQEKQRMAQMVANQKQQQEEYLALVDNIRNSAIKAIEAPFLGKAKLKKDEMAAVYDMIAEPSRETKGYQIYSEIDRLFESGDFDTLKEVALLLAKKEAYKGYINEAAQQQTATQLQRTLRIAGEQASSTGKDQPSDEHVRRQRYSTNNGARFGRE